MVGKRTLLALVAVSGLAGTPARADDDLVRTFALCAGRLSAQLEHQWLMNDPEAERTEQVRTALVELVELVTAPETAKTSLAIRIEAKHAQARLLYRATFNDDRADAAWAESRAAEQVAACASLLLS